ncbi:hypothetical protein FRC12_024462 [Ceratobasidium sp. 428]|nr:hypothetical protein FRC12_024462 [Ceratobasidium sp. 428]
MNNTHAGPRLMSHAPVCGQPAFAEEKMEIFIPLNVCERPKGSPGKGEFCMREVLGLTGVNYMIMLNAVRDMAKKANINFLKPFTRQNKTTVRIVCDKAAEMFPALRKFERCENPNWVAEALLQVALKSSSDRRRYIEKAQAATNAVPPSPHAAARRRIKRQEAARKGVATRKANMKARAIANGQTVDENEDDSVEQALISEGMGSLNVAGGKWYTLIATCA